MDEILWRATGVAKDTPDEAVKTALFDDVSVVVGGGILKYSWVQDLLLQYVVVKSMPKTE